MENKVNRDNGNKCTSTPKPFEYTLVKSSEGSGIGLSWKDKKKMHYQEFENIQLCFSINCK